MSHWRQATAAHFAALDLRGAQWMHRIAARRQLALALVVASRLGDGLVWYATMAMLPFVGGLQGTACALQMLAVGLLNLGVYKVTKQCVGRARPYVVCSGIRPCTSALDTYSFPSGHTLHAVAFAVVIGFHYPLAALVVGPFALAVAASRMVLGLHYPSDVAVGAALGLMSAALVLAVN